ncbi:flagellar hook protein FlgE [Atopomonas sediminilitoris]|uniref:flagellar hook protein FlgE n=1 Tax=Atopomonas sediminilitoris TaxID=2919919 RepID=UPI001F4EEBAD|nr:flagellar hook protein FlgE [Atopomonas sediminilitoris]MCJ8167969.1 flagellar hook protein FlgE [Atopomonas sediminilitoris]
MAFNTGLSGIRAAASDLNVTGNNIANAGTVGFKQSRAEFADVYAASTTGSGSIPKGSGVLLSDVSQLFNQGNINFTQNSLDLAINGNGFFVTSNNGEIGYTRAGYFGTDREGYLVNNFGYRLQGYGADANGNIINGVRTDLQIDTASQAPRATTGITQGMNLNAASTVPTLYNDAYTTAGGGAAGLAAARAVFDPTNPQTYNSATSVNVFDSLGNSHVLSQFYVLQPGTTNTWDVFMTMDGTALHNTAPQLPMFTAQFSSSGALTATTLPPQPPPPSPPLNASAGVATGIVGISAPLTNGAASPLTFDFDIRSSNQYAAAFAVNRVVQDGYTTGELAGLEIDDTGVAFARYTNGQSRVQGQVILASFANVQGLTPVGKTAWAESFTSGTAVEGTPRTGTLGALQSGALEQSNVELSDELVNLIVAQRNYQANAKTIQTEDTVTQTLINIR